MDCTEINSSFHRPHAQATYAKWASSTPPGFRFAVKIPRTITHDHELRHARAPLERLLGESAGLGVKHGPLLVQLPPSLAFNRRVVARFFDLLRARYDGFVVCEPRHPTWVSADADSLLVRYHVARVAADPAPAPGMEVPGGWSGIAYFRLHGSPKKYWSRYTSDQLEATRKALLAPSPAVDVWCVFDNTASTAAIQNAWDLRARLADAVDEAGSIIYSDVKRHC
jgi:uncharacterized protein YecE (DUF72 family)